MKSKFQKKQKQLKRQRKNLYEESISTELPNGDVVTYGFGGNMFNSEEDIVMQGFEDSFVETELGMEMVFTIPSDSWENWKSGKEFELMSVCGDKKLFKDWIENAYQNRSSILTNCECDKDTKIWCQIHSLSTPNKSTLPKEIRSEIDKGAVLFKLTLQNENYC